MDLALGGKVAMVAGASRGLGFAVARVLAAEGGRVSMVSRDGAAIDAAGKRIERETAAAFLLSDAASYVTGGTLQVDGGLIRAVL